ncbi:class V lanthionine synthetase subunit LxmK [Actinopolyspora mortivallis]|uniref:class V lanthionine synthetase subunit LxmK n=1 Tax=Actinopolyspora mortivallis TaxID=33906 RepID=UPI0011B1D5F0
MIDTSYEEDSSVSPRGGKARKNKGSTGFKPVDLDGIPAVEGLLTRLGLGVFLRDSLKAPIGRNDVWAGPTTVGKDVFVKRLLGSEEDVSSRMRRLMDFERFSAELPPGSARSPTLLGSDEKAGIVVYEYLDNTRNAVELVVDESFDDELSELVGNAMGRLHGTDPGTEVTIDTSEPPQPSVRLLYGLSSSMFENLSFGELSAWRIMQQDEELIRGVERLREMERRAPKVPAHCDLRVDQFLVAEDGLYVTDWEEFRLADAARDVGAFAGEWLHRSVLDIVTSRGDTTFVDTELTHEKVLERGVTKMRRLLPRVHHFWRGYLGARPSIDEEFESRATAFAGWHLLDRLIAAAARTARLSGIERAAAGVGRAALLTPEKFASTLGFEGAR